MQAARAVFVWLLAMVFLHGEKYQEPVGRDETDAEHYQQTISGNPDLGDLPTGFAYDGGAWIWRLDKVDHDAHWQEQMRQLGWTEHIRK